MSGENSDVLFYGAPALQPGQTELHAFGTKIFGRKIEDVKSDWERISHQLKEMVGAMGNQTPQGFTMDKVSVALAFSAEGKLVFIAEAGLEASITIEFTRQK